MAVFGYLFVLTGFYFLGIATLRYRDEAYTRAVGHTAAGLAFIVGGIAKVYGAERSPTAVLIFLFFFTVAMYAYFSVSK